VAATRVAVEKHERRSQISAEIGPPRRQIACPARARRNPYLRLLYTHVAARGLGLVEEERPQTVLSLGWLMRSRSHVGFIHLHWPESAYRHRGRPVWLRPVVEWFKLARFLARLATARLLDYRLVWTIHQVCPHESRMPRRDSFVSRHLARRCDVLLAHDTATLQEARAKLGPAAERIEIVPHGSYIGVYPPGRSREDVRAELGLPADAFVFLAFGTIRPYKDLDVLLEAFASTSARVGALVIAGNPKTEAVVRAVEAAAASDPRIKPLLGFVPDDQVAELFGACDAAVLSRGDGGTSGALILALSLRLPVVAADTPLYRELTLDYRAGWGFRGGQASSLAAALEASAADPVAAYAKGRVAFEIAQGLSWDSIADKTTQLLLAARRGMRRR
jgi:beta-1,4-mannosyltransferase